jgi:ketosteroid isomerase-like protein
MTEETTRAAVTDLYSAYAGGDGERMAALIADDVDFIIYGPVQVFPLLATTRARAPHWKRWAALPRTICWKATCLRSP